MDHALTQSPCVDVVIPVFNGAATIAAALHSVCAQQGNWVHKIIVVDDGSTDASAQVVESLQHPLVELVRTPNQGVTAARNLGIARCTAPWVAFLDADDVWLPGKLEAQLAAAHTHNAGFVCSAAQSNCTQTSGLISPRLLTRGNFVATSSVLVQRATLLQIQPVFTPGMSFAEDYLAWLKCVTRTRGYYIAQQWVDYILSPQPRYRWGQIVRNMLVLNQHYGQFLRHLGMPLGLRLGLRAALFAGSVRSVLSIMKRFINSYRARATPP